MKKVLFFILMSVCLLSQAQLTVPCEYKEKDAWVPGVIWADKETSHLCWGATVGGEIAGTLLIGATKEELGIQKISSVAKRLVWVDMIHDWEKYARDKKGYGESILTAYARPEGRKLDLKCSVRIVATYVAADKTAKFEMIGTDKIKREMRVAYKDRNDLLMLVGDVPEKMGGDAPKGKP